MAPSTLPSAISMYDQKSPKPRACHARRAIAGTSFSIANERTELSTVEIAETWTRSPFANAPAPRSAHQRRRQGRGRHDAELHDAFRFERDEGRPDRDAARVVARAVDRIDEPAARARALGALLFSQDRVAGAFVGEDAAKLGFDRAIRLGHRSKVGLRLDASPERKRRKRECVGSVGESERELEVGAHASDPSAADQPEIRKVGRTTFTATGADQLIAGVPTCAAFSPRTR